MTKGPKNIAASVHQRLLDKARQSSRPFNELLQYFAIERFIYRIAKSSYANRFILKGALMFSAWSGALSRPTMDIDLLGKIDNQIDTITAAIREACLIEVEADGLCFDAETVNAIRITEDADYKGVRVRVHGNMRKARISIQIDIGFGDVIVPNPERISYPTLLDFPTPELNGYTMESTIAEKFQAMVKLGVVNSRMKDFYDIWMLSRTFNFNGEILAEAVKKTFENRKTPLNLNSVVFDPSFGKDKARNVQWQGFIRKAKLVNAPDSFQDVIVELKIFLEPIASSIDMGQAFTSRWTAPGPWH